MFKQLLNKILFILFAVLLVYTANAQTKFGIIAGVGKNSLYQFPYSPDDFDRYSHTAAFWAGLSADIPLNKKGINVISSAAFARRGYKYFMQNETGAAGTLKDSSFSQQLNYADINLLLVKKFMFGSEEEEGPSNNFFAGTGPVFSVFLSGKENTALNYFGSTVLSDGESNSKLTVGNGAGAYKRLFLSWSFAAGLEINRIKIWASAAIPLDYYYQDAKKSVQHKLKTFGINAGYTLFTNVKREKPVKQVPYIPVAADSVKDSDGDGILDPYDRCPGHKGTAKYNGCPVPDSDGDGVNDDDDKCPALMGVASNDGCPVIKDTVKVSTADTTRFIIYFEPAKSILRSEGYQVLSEVVKMLKANPKMVVLFNGHTDYAGTAEANYKRSLERVTVCASYIQSFYIDKKRILTASYGNTMPAADLNDPLVQWKNRRVEVLVFER
jgi:outer membrane protein OmpA-like peptidoglycan-associated protein